MMLNHLVAFYVPSTQNATLPIPTKVFNARIREISLIMAKKFNGGTNIKGEGFFLTDDKKLIIEKVRIVQSNCNDKEQAISFLTELAKRKKVEWGQLSIMITADNGADFI